MHDPTRTDTPRRNLVEDWIRPRDWKAVADIERHAFKWPWTIQELRRAMAGRRTQGRILRDVRGTIVAYYLYRSEPRAIVLERMAVNWRREHQRQGYGRHCIEALQEKASNRGKHLRVYVPESQLDAQLFLAACGLMATLPIHQRYYQYPTHEEAAYSFVWDPNAASNRQRTREQWFSNHGGRDMIRRREGNRGGWDRDADDNCYGR